MRSVSVRLDDLRTMILNIGFVGENEHKRFIFDCKKMFDQYPHAAASMTVQPPEGEAYPAIIERDGDYVIWDVTDSDLAHDGDGELQLAFTQEPHIAKSYIGRTRICPALVPSGDIPEGIDDFLTRAGAALTAIPETIDTALAAAKASGEFDGADGQDGQDGADGFSPIVNVTEISGGHQVAVTDAEGTTTFDVMDGQNGSDGEPGADGFSPRATVSKSGKVATITITDAAGTTTAQISDGEDGQGTNIIDDEAGAGDTDKTFSADKLTTMNSELLSAISVLEPAATSSDVGKFLKAKTVSGGKVTEYEFGEGGGSGGTDDYSDLTNKPQINGVTLTGNKTAEDIGAVSAPKKLELSTQDGAGNVTLLNSKLSTEDVILEPGEYPLDGSVLIDGHTLDLNGSKVYYTEYVANRQMFVLAGYSPCIKNGELVGVISGNNHGNTGIGINESSDVLIENIKIKDFSGRGISGNGNSQYGERTAVATAASYSTDYTHVSPQIQMKNYKYVRTVGSYGYNSVYTLEPVIYKYYNSSNSLIKTDRLPPSVNSEIPDGAAYMTVETETGKYGLEDGFIPYQVGFTNHNNNLLIKDCIVKNCTEWGMANLFADSYLKNVDVCSIDIEDKQGTNVKIEDSFIWGNSFIKTYYATYKNTYFENIRSYYGKSHLFINCSGSYIAPQNNMYMQPAICMIGGNMNTYYLAGTSEDAKNYAQMLLTSGPVMTPVYNHYLMSEGMTQFLARYQGERNLVATFDGIVQGVYIKRVRQSGPPMNISTDKGSHLTIFADVETLGRQVHAEAYNDCYGIYYLNGIVYPKGYTIYDSYFKPTGTGNAQPSSVNACSGKYVDCTFDAKDYYPIDANKDKDLKFYNCRFINLSQNQIAKYSLYASSVKLEFINCYFDGHKIETQSDVETYILANTANATVIVDGTTIVGGT